MRRVAITGSTGYLGSVLADHLSSTGNEVVEMTRRRPDRRHDREWRRFDLAAATDDSALGDVDVLIHAAWVLSGKDTRQLWEQNVAGSRRLIDAAVSAGVEKVVFISSMSAFFGTRQAYGLMKLAVERTALDSGAVVVRPGLVYGESAGGMAKTLQTVSRLPVWPRFRGAGMFVAHDQDIAPAMARVLDAHDDFDGRVVGFANPRLLDLASILAGLTPGQRRKPSLPVPARLVMAPLRILEAAGVPFPFRSDSLLGLVEGATSLPGQDLLAKHGVTFRGMESPPVLSSMGG